VIETAYRTFARAAAPALAAWLRYRERQGKEDNVRIGERRGIAGKPRPAGNLAWLHAASVGEAMAVLPLLERLRATWPTVHLLVTSGTVTSARLLGERLPAGCIHQFMPLDVPQWIERFLDYWQPGAVLWTESEFWPNAIAAIRARGIPLALINARLSPRSFQRWQTFSRVMRPPLEAFQPCLAQDDVIAARLTALGAHHVQCLGNLKFDAEPLPADEGELIRLKAAIAGRPVWLAASIQPGEATAVADTHAALAAKHANLLTIVVPRHPARGAEIADLLGRAGLTVALRSAGTLPMARTDAYIADTMGELGLFFRLAPVVFMGGSLVPHGGQNALEPARLDAAIVLGPHMHNFPEVTAALLAAGGAEQISSARDLPAAIDRLLTDTATAAARAAAARRVADTGRGTVTRVATALIPLLEPLSGPPEKRRATA
jgi:3-deoxy-D-manno-octulosonic-acid transferase